MYNRVTISQDEHFRVEDVDNLSRFPQKGAEKVIADWLGDLRYRNLTTVKDGQNAVQVAAGSAYVGGRQYVLADPRNVSLIDEKPLVAGQRRVVVLAAQGIDDRPAPAVGRDKTVEVPDGDGGSVTQDVVVTVSPYAQNVIEVAKLASGLSTQELDPVIPANVVPFCRIVLDVDGIVGEPAMLWPWRIRSVNELDIDQQALAALMDIFIGEIQALRNELVALQSGLRNSVSHATIEAVIYDVATLKDINAIGDAGAPYALDRFASAAEVAADHIDFKGRIGEGFQLPYAAEDKRALSLWNPNDTRLMHANAGLLFPAYDPVVGYAVHSTGMSAPLGGTVTQTMTLTKIALTRLRVRYGRYFHYLQPLLFNKLLSDADIVYRVFARQGEALAYPYGFYADRYRDWVRFYRRRLIVDRFIHAYDVWLKTTATIQGVIKAQTWLQAQERFIPAIRLGILNWAAGAEVTVALCKLRTDGSPDPTQVIQSVTVAATAFKKYTQGNADTMTRFAFPAPAHVARGGVGFLTSTSGNVTIAMASGDRFLGGNYFESTDGNFFIGSITQDMAHAVEYCQFRATTMDIRLNNLSLSGGIEGADINCPAVLPDNAVAQFQPFTGGAWKTMAQLPGDEGMVETEDDQIFGNGTGSTYDFRVYLTGNEWVMPVLDLGNSELTVFRADDDLRYVSVPRSVPTGPTWSKVQVRARVAGYDAARHTLTAVVKHGTALTTEVAADGPAKVTPVPGNNAVDLEWEMTVDPNNNLYQVHITGATNNIAVPLSLIEVFSKVVE
ncbi:hypothetical protein [Shinella sp.]|uniref:hypothetical protein n=1 Tax=Shinella sp. TaxID=1870904 RepID=UPI0025907866|nr:hypothetical protein [Shinella sp.]MCW5712745.1 hypothetical protein [Shinella sp.]